MSSARALSQSGYVDRNLGPVARTSGTQGGAGEREVRVSYEFFPPKTDKMERVLWSSIEKLSPLQPDFVSVTYGAGGSTRERTHKTVARIASETPLAAAAHLTCVGSPREEIDAIADAYWEAGVRHIVALRGDPPDGIGERYHAHPGGYAYASDLVEGLRARHDFEVSVGAYPERHPESADWGAELDNLRRKVDAGATRAITQFFFSPETYMRFLDRVLDAGIDIAVVPGLMLQPNFKGLKRMAEMTGVEVPNWYATLFEGLEDDAHTRELLTASLVSELTAELYDRGVRDFHLYTLNRADLALAVSRVLGRRGEAASPPASAATSTPQVPELRLSA